MNIGLVFGATNEYGKGGAGIEIYDNVQKSRPRLMQLPIGFVNILSVSVSVSYSVNEP